MNNREKHEWYLKHRSQIREDAKEYGREGARKIWGMSSDATLHTLLTDRAPVEPVKTAIGSGDGFSHMSPEELRMLPKRTKKALAAEAHERGLNKVADEKNIPKQLLGSWCGAYSEKRGRQRTPSRQDAQAPLDGRRIASPEPSQSSAGSLHPAITGLLLELPEPGTPLTQIHKEGFRIYFSALVDLIYPNEPGSNGRVVTGEGRLKPERRNMPIEGVSNVVRIPRKGKIKLGKLKEGDKGPYPSPTDHFVCPDEVREVFGEEPKELDIVFPSDDEELVAQQWYRCYSKTKGLVCVGDGVSCRRKVDLDTGAMASRHTREWEWMEDLACNPQDCPAYLSKRCKRMMNLQFLLPTVKGLGAWQVNTSSWHSIVNINNFLRTVRQYCGHIAWLPLVLRLEPQEVEPPGVSRHTVHVLKLDSKFSLVELLAHVRKEETRVLMPSPDVETPPEDHFPEEVLEAAEAQDEGQEAVAVEKALDRDEATEPSREQTSLFPEGTVIHRDVSLIRSEMECIQACYEDFKLQPRQALAKSGYSSKAGVKDWNQVYLNVAEAMGARLVEPSP